MSGPNENGGDGFCGLGETVGDERGEVLGFVPELGDEDANATELQQHPRCTLARAVFGAFRTSGAVVSAGAIFEQALRDCAALFEAGGKHKFSGTLREVLTEAKRRGLLG